MLFSDFINNSLLGENNILWNYYHADICTDNILQAEPARNFILQYFRNGEKALPLLLNPEDVRNTLENNRFGAHRERHPSFSFNGQYTLPDVRAIHTVSGFFLGLLIENCLNAGNSLSIENPDYFPFSYLWFLTFLYHDYGYCIAEREDAPIRMPRKAPIPNSINSQHGSKIPFAEYRALRQVKDALGITFSPFSGYLRTFSMAGHLKGGHARDLECEPFQMLARQLLNANEQHPTLQFNTGTRISGHRYRSSVVTRYFNYCINERAHLDHGIIGGYLFYDRIFKNYLYAYLCAKREAQHPVALTEFYFHDKHFSENQLTVFSYIADCILSHNIWKQSEETRAQYEQYSLDKVLGEEYKTITIKDNPLLYILAIADTLEPTKAYAAINPKTVSESISLKYRPGSSTLTISSNNNAVDIRILHRKAKGLEEWTSARCSELRNGTFTLQL